MLHLARAAYPLALVLLAACGDDDAPPSLDGGMRDAAPSDAGVDAAPPPSRAAPPPFVQWVDPFIGTGGVGFSVGSTYPGPARPFGMVHPGPDTSIRLGAAGPQHCSGYWYADDEIRGFSHTRMNGTGIPDYGIVALMPVVGMSAEKTTRAGYTSRYSHDTEEASVGYYAVTLDDTDVRVELTATARVGLHRYTYPTGSDAVVLMDVGYGAADVDVIDGNIAIDVAARELSGMSHVDGGYSGRFGGQPVYFAVRFSRPFATFGVWKAGELFEGELTRDGADSGAWVAFDPADGEVVEAAVGISFVDVEHARMNLAAEAPAFDFDGVRADAEAEWEPLLARAEVEARTEREFEMFYSALYRALLMPTLAMDVDGSYRGLDGEVHVADGFTYYTDLSLWDTYRTLHPLLTLLYPAHQLDFLKSLMAMARDGGGVPRWPLGIGYTGGMLGDPADIVFADSWVKGVRDFDLREAYDALRVTATAAPPVGATFDGRNGIAEWTTIGYVPVDTAGGSASWTLELAYADHAMATLAGALGETADQAMFMERAGGYAHLFHEESGFLVGRRADGTFDWDGDALVWQDYYAEGNAWQYNWFVPHDLDGLAALYGGRAQLLARLEMFFEMSLAERYLPLVPDRYYWHGNEPDIHAPWIFAALDSPARTQRYVRWVAGTRYGDGPDGLPGNDDGGTLSAWYVFAAIGLFPIAGLDYYVVGSPTLTRATLHLPAGDLTVEAPASTNLAMYVQSATLDGAALDRARIPHADLADGATLRLDLGEAASAWGEM